MEGSHQSVGRGRRKWKIAACRRESKGAWNPLKGAKRSGVGLGVHGAMASSRRVYKKHRSGEAQLNWRIDAPDALLASSPTKINLAYANLGRTGTIIESGSRETEHA